MSIDNKKIRIASLNTNDVKDRNRFRQVVTQMRKDAMTVLILQDIHVDEGRAEELEDDFPSIKNLAACEENGTAGLMILIDSAQAEFDGDIEEMNNWGLVIGRVLVITVKINRETFTMRCVYAPSIERERIG